MATVASRIRTTAAVTAATAVPLIIVAGLGNQALQSWRDTQANSSNHWIADDFQPLALAGWRFSPGSGPNATAHWLAPLVFNIALVVLTALLATAAAHNRGRLALFFGVWGAVTLAGAGAGLICTPFAYSGVPTAAAADNYRTTLAEGMLLGFFIGFVTALIATAFAGGGKSATKSSSGAEPATTMTPGYDETWPVGS
jgi:hypothetical protein